MKSIRRCGKQCHTASGSRCQRWCAGFFHGKNGTGSTNRAALASGMTQLLDEHGFKKGETAYIEQLELPLIEQQEG